MSRFEFVRSMRRLGFTPYYNEETGLESWQNMPVNQGGIRVEMVEDVASVWCVSPRYANAAMPSEDVVPVVCSLMGKHVADALITDGHWQSPFPAA